MGIREAILGESSDGLSLSERYQAMQVNEGFLIETIRELEGDLAMPGWRRMSAEAEVQFTRAGLIDLIEASRAMYLVNPLIQRGVDVTTFYTWGQGVTYQANETRIHEEIIAPMIDNEANRAELYDHTSQVLVDVDQQIEGNIFFAMPTNYFGEVSVRQIPTLQITEIIRKPGDQAVIMYYRRKWTEAIWSDNLGTIQVVEREALYPDWRWTPKSQPARAGDVEVKWNSPIIHQKSGGTKMMDFGIPMTYSSMAWAKAYKNFLEDWHTIVKSLARFAWKNSGKEKPLEKLRDKLKNGPSKEGDEENGRRRRKDRGVGDIYQGPPGADLTPINKSGTTTNAEDARMSRLMVSSGMNLPDTMLSGDAQQGALATAQTLDRPTELFMTHRQLFWATLQKSIFRYSIDSAVRAGQYPGKLKHDYRTGVEIIVPDGDPLVNVMFPPVLEHDQKKFVEAINIAAAFIPEETTTKLALETLGVDNIKAAMDQMDKEREERKKEAEEMAKEMSPEEKEQLEEAMGRLREVLANADRAGS